MTVATTQPSLRPRLRPRLRLTIIAAGAAILWLVVLPWIADRPAIESRLRWLRDRGIDPSATYYTELEVMDEILARRRQERPDGGAGRAAPSRR